MSQTEQQQQQQPAQEQQQDKSMDKKEIDEEEREKMLNAENTKHSGAAPAPELEVDEQKPKRKIPIGGIKMPGFCRSKSKEPCKEEDAKPNETNPVDGETPKEGENGSAVADKTNNAAAKEPKESQPRAQYRLLQQLRAPFSRVVFGRQKKQEVDAELGATGPAGLVSAETLDDSAQEKNNAAAAAAGEDGMETVRLDGDATDGQPTKPHPLVNIITFLRQNSIVACAGTFAFVILILIIAFAFAGPRRVIPSPIKDGKVIAQTSCGLVEGLVEEDASVFRGIPYAKKPIGELRWRHSEPLNPIDLCWNGTYKAHNSSEVCWQRIGSKATTGSEDCLYLDIYTPEVRYQNPVPVVVMIGADTLSGPSPGIMIPSGKLAHVREMIFVRPNFRLDAFGFLAAEPLSRSSHPMTSGNYGLSDIILALKWVQNNIVHFGGDNRYVTLWGHRAGGTLVTALVTSRQTKGLFANAWISSGSANFPKYELRESEQQSRIFLENIRCKDADCLRKKSAEEVLRAVPESWYIPNDGIPDKSESEMVNRKHEWVVKDEVIIQHHIGKVFSGNESLPVKVVMGSTAQSGRLPKTITYNSTVSPQEIKKIVSESLIGAKGFTDQAIAQYNATVSGLHTMISDIRVVCPLMTVATMRTDIPFYISTFPGHEAADVDSDAAVILGFAKVTSPEHERHHRAMQILFDHFVCHGKVKDADKGNRILIVGQDPQFEVNATAGYKNCKLWIENGLVPTYARVD